MSERVEKVNELIMRYAAEAILEHLPREAGMVTVTRVDTAPDLRTSKVWVSVVSQDPEESLAQLEQVRRDVQMSINPKLTMKYTPRLEFLRDESAPYVQKMEKLFRQIKES
jgi:ribosome-binding factor A